jgi:hypothetical protein
MLQTEPRHFFVVRAEDVIGVAFVGHDLVTARRRVKTRPKFRRRHPEAGGAR